LAGSASGFFSSTGFALRLEDRAGKGLLSLLAGGAGFALLAGVAGFALLAGVEALPFDARAGDFFSSAGLRAGDFSFFVGAGAGFSATLAVDLRLVAAGFAGSSFFPGKGDDLLRLIGVLVSSPAGFSASFFAGDLDRDLAGVSFLALAGVSFLADLDGDFFGGDFFGGDFFGSAFLGGDLLRLEAFGFSSSSLAGSSASAGSDSSGMASSGASDSASAAAGSSSSTSI